MTSYIHGTSEDEQRRLSLMNDVLLNPAMLRELALHGDERVVDFGSGLGQFTRAMARATPGGRVVGIERDEAQLAGARARAAEAGEADLVDFRRGDVFDPPLAADEWGTFDVAHTRFVLEHVNDPLRVVKTMLHAVRPGGRIILADDDHSVLRLWPELPGWNDLWAAYMRTYDRIGADPLAGRRLVSLLHEAGAAPRRNTWVFFGGCAGMEHFEVVAKNMAGVVRTAREAILSMDLDDRAHFDEVLAGIEVWFQRPDAAIWFAVSWAEGVRKSEG